MRINIAVLNITHNLQRRESGKTIPICLTSYEKKKKKLMNKQFLMKRTILFVLLLTECNQKLHLD